MDEIEEEEYGCPTMDEIEEFSREFKKRLDEAGVTKVVPDDLALEVPSPGAERLLRVPEDLPQFKDMPMTVSYVEETNSRQVGKSEVFVLESIDAESDNCIWKLADVKENRDPESNGRPLSRKQKDLRIKLPFTDHRKISLYVDLLSRSRSRSRSRVARKASSLSLRVSHCCFWIISLSH